MMQSTARRGMKVVERITIVVRTETGWAIEQHVGEFAVVFNGEYLSCTQAKEAAERLFPNQHVTVAPVSRHPHSGPAAKPRPARRIRRSSH
ncbi:hypothetical protein CBM2615_B200077 [Cupriavidus taiwanensis]|uniref:Uncharacterized protein n=1 Tax=Cupriavidus taiwanensis TaxID=164546 RepID=A0A375E957_9BURK|nr:hypothetical protein CBM2614_B210077 [Cupriavidus taiwanensis]SOZ68581.1 hypothetical protein CBM2615_B200077 [Cupriavidus taiwanensis]SOZ71606.1 hypothetical protein CBM2613_B180076 [Cupriavidus taiwanensis]SPA09415.1 hypothetical protein CBM2625_B180076 [Cupriavidus taiwanensis]